MVEFGRFAQVNALQAQGWYEDEETQRFDAMDARDLVCGGPTYLKNPEDGLLYECTCGIERPVNGRYALTTDPLRGKQFTTYQGGKIAFVQGNP